MSTLWITYFFLYPCLCLSDFHSSNSKSSSLTWYPPCSGPCLISTSFTACIPIAWQVSAHTGPLFVPQTQYTKSICALYLCMCCFHCLECYCFWPPRGRQLLCLCLCSMIPMSSSLTALICPSTPHLITPATLHPMALFYFLPSSSLFEMNLFPYSLFASFTRMNAP